MFFSLLIKDFLRMDNVLNEMIENVTMSTSIPEDLNFTTTNEPTLFYVAISVWLTTLVALMSFFFIFVIIFSYCCMCFMANEERKYQDKNTVIRSLVIPTEKEKLIEKKDVLIQMPSKEKLIEQSELEEKS